MVYAQTNKGQKGNTNNLRAAHAARFSFLFKNDLNAVRDYFFYFARPAVYIHRVVYAVRVPCVMRIVAFGQAVSRGIVQDIADTPRHDPLRLFGVERERHIAVGYLPPVGRERVRKAVHRSGLGEIDRGQPLRAAADDRAVCVPCAFYGAGARGKIDLRRGVRGAVCGTRRECGA